MKHQSAGRGEPPSSRTFASFLKNNKNTILPILAFCIPVLLYLHTTGFGFIGFDDRDVIMRNFPVLSDFKNIPEAFQKDAFLGKTSQFYRPLQTLSFMADIGLSGGNNPWMYHLTSVMLLGLISCVLFLLLRKLSVPAKAAFLGTMIYCAHPLFVSSVAWIPGRGDWLLVLFSLLSFYFFLERLRQRKPVYLILHWLFFTFALFCKETAAILPLIFIVSYFTFSPQKRFETKHIPDIALYAVSGIVWFLLRLTATRALAEQGNVGVTAFLSNLRAIPESLARLFVFFDSSFISSFSLPYTLLGLGIMILIGVVFFLNKERPKREKFFGIAWFALLMLPALVIREHHIDYLSHRLFLPLIGVLIFALFVIPKQWLEENTRVKKIMVNGGALCVFAVFAAVTVVNSRSFSDPMTFWNNAIAGNTRNVLMYTNRGFEKYVGNDFPGAIEDFTKVIELDPDDAAAYNNRGTVYSAAGDLERAVREYEKAIELDPGHAEAYHNLGKVFADKGDYDRAIRYFTTSIELNPNGAEAYTNRGNAHADKGDRAAAGRDYDNAVRVDPDFADAHINRGNLYSAEGDIEKAIASYERAAEANPHFAEAYNNLGLAYQSKGDSARAIANFDTAIRLKPGLPAFYYNRGNSFLAHNSIDSAINDFQKAVALDPKYAEAHNNLGLAYQAAGGLDDALQAFDRAVALKPGLAEAYYNRGNVHLMRRDPDRAVGEYDAAIRLKPDYAQAYGIRGIAHSMKGDLDAAIRDYRKAIALDPADANAYGNLGNAYKAKGMLKEAERQFDMYEKLTGGTQR